MVWKYISRLKLLIYLSIELSFYVVLLHSFHHITKLKKWFKSIGNKCSAECHSSMQFSPILLSPIKKYVELLCECAYETHSTKKYDKIWILSLSYPFNSVYWVFSTSNGILFLISFVMLLKHFYGLHTFHCHYRTIQCRKYCGGCNISL